MVLVTSRNSPARMGQMVVASMAVICISVGLLLVATQESRQQPFELGQKGPKIVQMSDWELSGKSARHAMSRYFNKQNFHTEAENLQHYFDDHPFFDKKSHTLRMPPHARKFNVLGFNHHNTRYSHARLTAKHRQHRALHSGSGKH
mmetsp:Transcript_1193/g.1963  ORF Transcript_1193/g.1963 Transcript_1193/m.1963 type:complete len:146 (+) Transcript_1193:145-582(+)